MQACILPQLLRLLLPICQGLQMKQLLVLQHMHLHQLVERMLPGPG